MIFDLFEYRVLMCYYNLHNHFKLKKHPPVFKGSLTETEQVHAIVDKMPVYLQNNIKMALSKLKRMSHFDQIMVNELMIYAFVDAYNSGKKIGSVFNIMRVLKDDLTLLEGWKFMNQVVANPEFFYNEICKQFAGDEKDVNKQFLTVCENVVGAGVYGIIPILVQKSLNVPDSVVPETSPYYQIFMRFKPIFNQEN